jgi:DNA-binding response OmpR family regulator
MSDHVLVVDDNRDAADTIASLVETCGYKAKAVYSGEEAVCETGTFLPDMVLLDLAMPGLDGFETVANIRRKRPAVEVVVIAVTAFDSEEHKRRAYDGGFDLYVTKPLSVNKLRDLLALLDPSIGSVPDTANDEPIVR